jgi:hypothetical protein
MADDQSDRAHQSLAEAGAAGLASLGVGCLIFGCVPATLTAIVLAPVLLPAGLALLLFDRRR